MKPVRLPITLRLTLWNASVLAFVLVLFGAAGWLTLRRAVRERSISSVSESAQAVAAAVHAERLAVGSTTSGPVWPDTESGAQVIVQELEVGGLDVFITGDVWSLETAESGVEGASVIASRESGGTPELPKAVLSLLHDMRSGGDPAMASALKSVDSVVVRQVVLAGVPARVAFTRVAPAGSAEPALLITAILSEAGDWLLLNQVRNTLLLAIPVVLLASILAGYGLARRSLEPLEEINAHTAAITADNLSARLPVLNQHDELGKLTAIINGLLTRVDQAFRLQRQFMADASHELRTPIAIMRGEADVTLRRSARSEEEYRDALAVIQGESIRLTRIVDDLFLLARVDAAGPIASQEEVDLQELVLDATRSVRSLAGSRNVAIEWRFSEALSSGAVSATVAGNANLLHRLLINLLDNALKHSPTGGRVLVTLDGNDDELILRVSDEGPGVSDSVREKIFERFVHDPQTADGVSRAGAGLGLAIVRAIVAAHGGHVELLPRRSGSATGDADLDAAGTPPPLHGAAFEVRLPTSRAAKERWPEVQ